MTNSIKGDPTARDRGADAAETAGARRPGGEGRGVLRGRGRGRLRYGGTAAVAAVAERRWVATTDEAEI